MVGVGVSTGLEKALRRDCRVRFDVIAGCASTLLEAGGRRGYKWHLDAI